MNVLYTSIELASQQTLYTTELTHLQSQIVEAEKQRRKYMKLIDADDTPNTTLASELRKYELEKATLQEQKRHFEMNVLAHDGNVVLHVPVRFFCAFFIPLRKPSLEG